MSLSRRLQPSRQSTMRGRRSTLRNAAALALLSATPALTQDSGECISLEGSTACPAFQSGSVFLNQSTVQEFSFLGFVSDLSSFDDQLVDYVKGDYVAAKYRDLFGCDNVNLANTSDFYARFTTSVICNAIVQKSLAPCDISDDDVMPLCAESCAEYAQSEAYLTSDQDLCASPNEGITDLIRADFTNCYLPRASLGNCVTGIENEGENCGFANSTIGFCSFCSEGGLNSTDSCCVTGQAEDRCEGVEIPVFSSTVSLPTPSATSEPTNTASSSPEESNDGDDGLSGGVIAGIVIGAIAGLILIALMLFFCLRRRGRRSHGSQNGSILNQPSPARTGPNMAQAYQPDAPQGYEVLPGGRIARMSALEGHSGDDGSHHHGKALAAGAAGAGYMAGRKGDTSSSDFGDSPLSENRAGVLRPPPNRRNGSLSSNSMFGSSVPQSPDSNGGFSSPQGVASQQSEQLPFFKDYYSPEDIHPSDRVAVLWAYQPRAADEFALERGDMLKVVGIWDDGWATGVLLNDRADDWEARRQAQRDSGVSNASGRRNSSPAASGEIKAFPLVCVCLPDSWRKTIEGDASTEASLGPAHIP